MSKKNDAVAIAYVPVLHRGYLNFLAQLESEGVYELWLVGDDVLLAHEELDYLNRKDRLRAVPVEVMQQTLNTITALKVEILTTHNVDSISAQTIITPREDIGEVVVANYFKDKTVDYRDVFVRRHQHNVGETKEPQSPAVTLDEFQTKLWADVLTEAAKSADWWRQVGAALVKGEEVLFITHNEHMPEEQLPNIEGDARSLFKKGVSVNYVTAAHAEATVIAEAARQGIATDGAEIFVTDFPCPYCARIIVKAGIKKVYFQKGYAVLDGDNFLKDEGVEVIKVKSF